MPHTLRARSALAWLIGACLGMTGCGAGPTAQPAQSVPPTAIVRPTAPRRTAVPPRLTPSSAPASATIAPAPTDAPTVAPAIEATPSQAVGLVTNGGNLRTEPRIAPQTVIGQVCPGDQVALLESRQVDSTLWYRVRLNQLAKDCDPSRVAVDAEGWLSSLLISAHSASIGVAAPGAPQPDADPRPTPVPPRATSVPPSNDPFNVPGVQGTIVFVGEDINGWDIYTSHLDGTGLLRLTTHGMAALAAPAWSPDGTRIAFEAFEPQPDRAALTFIFLMNADGTGVTKLPQVGAEHPSWSPDGKRIAFEWRHDEPNGEIYVMNADGTNVIRLTNDQARDSQPSWSPDGKRIAFARRDSGTSDIYVMNVDGSGLTRLTDHPENDSAPAWSPDGTRIAFQSQRNPKNDFGHDIYVMNADGSEVTRLTKDSADDITPAWSPDGTHIAFVSNRAYRNVDIYVMRADGSRVIRLTKQILDDTSPDWTR
jgi:Tol biopolymer transport system component